MEKQVLEIITEITMQNKAAKTEPTYALSIEVFRKLQTAIPEVTIEQFQNAVNNLCKTGKLDHGKTVNQIYLQLKS